MSNKNSFEEWFDSEKFHKQFDCNQVTSARMAWNYQQEKIDSLEQQLQKQLEMAEKTLLEIRDTSAFFSTYNNTKVYHTVINYFKNKGER